MEAQEESNGTNGRAMEKEKQDNNGAGKKEE